MASRVCILAYFFYLVQLFIQHNRAEIRCKIKSDTEKPPKRHSKCPNCPSQYASMKQKKQVLISVAGTKGDKKVLLVLTERRTLYEYIFLLRDKRHSNQLPVTMVQSFLTSNP